MTVALFAFLQTQRQGRRTLRRVELPGKSVFCLGNHQVIRIRVLRDKGFKMDFRELSNKRFSVRKYTDEPVSDADIEYIMECVRLAPSACNKQPWKFLLLTSDEAKGKIRQCYDRPWFATAPLYFVCMKSTDGSWVRPDDGKAHGDIDLGIAVEHLCLAAADRGRSALAGCATMTLPLSSVSSLWMVSRPSPLFPPGMSRLTVRRRKRNAR